MLVYGLLLFNVMVCIVLLVLVIMLVVKWIGLLLVV